MYPNLGSVIAVGAAQFTLTDLDVGYGQVRLSCERGHLSARLRVAVDQFHHEITVVSAAAPLQGADGPLLVGDLVKVGSGKVEWEVVGYSASMSGRVQLSVKTRGGNPQGNTLTSDKFERIHHIDQGAS